MNPKPRLFGAGVIVPYRVFEEQLRARKQPPVRWGPACRIIMIDLRYYYGDLYNLDTFLSDSSLADVLGGA